MKRKAAGAIMLAGSILCTSLFSACAEIGDFFDDLFDRVGIHFHNYDSAWTSDTYYHWHECLNSGCDAPESGKDIHTDSDENGECDVCGHAVALPHPHEYQWINNGDGTHRQHCKVKGCLAPDLNVGAHYFEEDGFCVCGADVSIEGHAHNLTYVPYRAATCTRDGNIAYYTCSGCVLLFTDDDAQNEVELDDTVLQASGHQPMGNGVCGVCGNVDWDHEQFNLIERCSSTYGYDYLGTMNKGAERQALYNEIDKAVRAVHDDVENYESGKPFQEVSFNNTGLFKDDALAVWKTYTDDHPLYYWFSNTIGYRANERGDRDNALLLYVDDEYLRGDVRAEYNRLIYTKIQEYLAYASQETSAYQIALAFHDKIITSIDYAYKSTNVPETAKWAHSIAGVFEERGAVCEGYAKTFQLLLNMRGIKNILVDGNGNGESHAWNLIQLDDGGWYWCDLTWDDVPSYTWGIYYGYFCVNDLQGADWVDGSNQTGNETGIGIGGSPSGCKTFTDSHKPYTPQDRGINFLYDLPARSTTVYEGATNELTLRDTFELGGIQYAVAGYGTVQVTKVQSTGEVVLPENVKFLGVDYTVISIGVIGGTKLFGAGSVFNSAVTSLTLPSTLVCIWGLVFYNTHLNEINFNGTQTEWTAVIKQRYWKGDKPLIVHCDGGDVTE